MVAILYFSKADQQLYSDLFNSKVKLDMYFEIKCYPTLYMQKQSTSALISLQFDTPHHQNCTFYLRKAPRTSKVNRRDAQHRKALHWDSRCDCFAPHKKIDNSKLQCNGQPSELVYVLRSRSENQQITANKRKHSFGFLISMV